MVLELILMHIKCNEKIQSQTKKEKQVLKEYKVETW